MGLKMTQEFELPSRGKCYDKEIKWRNILRAPKLKDRGFGDILKKNQIQASILDKTIEEDLGMSTYDLHPADFVYLNFIQRRLLKGDEPYKIRVKCRNCGKEDDVDIPLEEIEITTLKEYSHQEVMMGDTKIVVRFATPRILDAVGQEVELFREEFPDAEGDLEMQEYLRKVIVSVDDKRLSYPQMTSFIQNLFLTTAEEILEKSLQYEWGMQLIRKHICSACGKVMTYNLPV